MTHSPSKFRKRVPNKDSLFYLFRKEDIVKQEMTLDEIYEHADIVRKMVWHKFDNNKFGLNINNPHAEDCEGCVIEAEVTKLTDKLRALAPMERIMTELKEEKKNRKALEKDRERAFVKAGLVEEGLVSDLVVMLMESNDRLRNQIKVFKNDINAIAREL
jgi:patatin-like phospholipase/acyl hydrolase